MTGYQHHENINRLYQQTLNKEKCQDLTEQDLRDKDPEPADKWVNAATMKTAHPEMITRWDRD